MKLTEFLAELRKTRNGWTAGECIRKQGRNEHCPITAVCSRVKKTYFSPWAADAAGLRLGLDPKLTKRIVNAADYDCLEYAWMRSRLLKTVGK